MLVTNKSTSFVVYQRGYQLPFHVVVKRAVFFDNLPALFGHIGKNFLQIVFNDSHFLFFQGGSGIAFNANYSFLPVLMVIFGGSQNLLGPIIGAAVFAYLQELLTTKFPYIYMLAMGVIMIAAILFMPRGILGVVKDAAARVRKRKEAGKDARS